MSPLLWPELEEGAVDEGWLPEIPSMTSAQVLDALARRHPMDGFNGVPGRWVFVPEVQAATGSYADVQRFDAVAIGLVPSVRYARIVYEVKVSRADWLRELKPIPDVRYIGGRDERRMNPRTARRVVAAIAEDGDREDRNHVYRIAGEYHKWDAALAVSTEFWIAAPPKVVQLHELPPEAGLVEIRAWGPAREMRARIVRKAPVRDTPHPGADFWASILRRAARR